MFGFNPYNYSYDPYSSSSSSSSFPFAGGFARAGDGGRRPNSFGHYYDPDREAYLRALAAQQQQQQQALRQQQRRARSANPYANRSPAYWTYGDDDEAVENDDYSYGQFLSPWEARARAMQRERQREEEQLREQMLAREREKRAEREREMWRREQLLREREQREEEEEEERMKDRTREETYGAPVNRGRARQSQVQQAPTQNADRTPSISKSHLRPSPVRVSVNSPSRSPHPSHPSQPQPFPNTTVPTSTSIPTSTPAPVRTSSQNAHTEEELNNAATLIQTTYRRHKSVQTIQSLHSQFESLKSTFHTNTDRHQKTIDFLPPNTKSTVPGASEIITVPVPAVLSSLGGDSDGANDAEEREELRREARLAYTFANAPIHAYSESLVRLLNKLDAVESNGDKSIRERRKGVVRAVEKEAEEVERRWRDVWVAHCLGLLHDREQGQEQEAVMTVGEKQTQNLNAVDALDADTAAIITDTSAPVDPQPQPQPPSEEAPQQQDEKDHVSTEREPSTSDAEPSTHPPSQTREEGEDIKSSELSAPQDLMEEAKDNGEVAGDMDMDMDQEWVKVDIDEDPVEVDVPGLFRDRETEREEKVVERNQVVDTKAMEESGNVEADGDGDGGVCCRPFEAEANVGDDVSKAWGFEDVDENDDVHMRGGEGESEDVEMKVTVDGDEQ